jgi:hypothetical protein
MESYYPIRTTGVPPATRRFHGRRTPWDATDRRLLTRVPTPARSRREMRREEAEREAAWRNAHDERRTRLEFHAFDVSAGMADDAWDISMRLRRQPAPPPPASPPDPAATALQSAAPEPGPEPMLAPEPEATPAPEAAPAAKPALEPEPPVAPREEPPVPPAPAVGAESEPAARFDAPPQPRVSRLESVRGRVRTTRERMGSARETLRGAQEGMRAAQQRARDTQRRMRAAQRPRLARRSRRPDAGNQAAAADLGLEPPTRLERLTRLVGTAVIVVAVLWVGMVTALAVLSGATSVVGLLIYVGGVLIGLAGVGLGVLIRRT